MNNTLLRAMMLLLCTVLSAKELRADATTTSCPSGYRPSAVANVCIANSLVTSVVQSLPATGQCLTGYARVIGTAFCTKDNLALNRVAQHYLISPATATTCPVNFSRAPGSTICTANHLALDFVDNALTLIEPRLNCPSGTVQLTGANLCSPIVSSSLPMTPPVGLDCPPGFLKPFGSHFCVAVNIAVNTDDHTNFGLTPPTGQCPTHWFQYKNGGFCLPAVSIVSCGTPDYPCRQESNDTYFVVKQRFVCAVDGGTRQGTHSPYVPNDPLGFTAIPNIWCTPPKTNEHN